MEKGKSPYFNKYGNSRICHEAFGAAQERARSARLGIWDPRTICLQDINLEQFSRKPLGFYSYFPVSGGYASQSQHFRKIKFLIYN